MEHSGGAGQPLKESGLGSGIPFPHPLQTLGGPRVDSSAAGGSGMDIWTSKIQRTNSRLPLSTSGYSSISEGER